MQTVYVFKEEVHYEGLLSYEIHKTIAGAISKLKDSVSYFCDQDKNLSADMLEKLSAEWFIQLESGQDVTYSYSSMSFTISVDEVLP